MRNAHWIWVLGVAILASSSPISAWAEKDCGDTTGQPGGFDVPCDCGDTVTTDTVLNASDPVTRKVCFPVGLFVEGSPGTNLDVSSAHIRCDSSLGLTIGIFINRDGVIVDGGSGIIDGCSFGIFGTTSGSTIERVTVRNGQLGFLLVGNSNTLRRNLCENNTPFGGIFVGGDSSTLARNYCKGNAGDGIAVEGSSNRLERNRGQNNGGHGVVAIGSNNLTDGLNFGTGNESKPDCSIDGQSVPGTRGRYC